MNSVCRDIFRAVHEGKWISIEYRNRDGEVTKYWIAVKEIHLKYKTLRVDGLHLSLGTCQELTVYIESILSSAVVDGSYCPVNKALVEDIHANPKKFEPLFGDVLNLKILDYLADCNRLDTVPYQCDYSLLSYFDEDRLAVRNAGTKNFMEYRLTDGQFREIVRHFQYRTRRKAGAVRIRQLCLNVMSIHFKEGLYVLAYRRLNLDVKARILKPEEEVTICREFTVDGDRQSVRRFLDADDYILLDDFERNAEQIKDQITRTNTQVEGVDDMPYLIAIGMNCVDLKREYDGILDMYREERATAPIRAFFGDYLERPIRRKEFPPALLDRRVNLDQLRAIHSAMKYPLAYIQGPPGTGKTTTIVNTIMTAFFNGRTVLLCSYNNHPIDGVFEKLSRIAYKKGLVPFPIVRLGNNDKVAEALVYMREIYGRTKDLTVYDSTLEKNKDDKIRRTRELTALLKKREEILDLEERRDIIEKLLAANGDLRFHAELEGRQLTAIQKRLAEIGEVSDADAMALVEDDEAEFSKYLYYTSAKFIKRLGEEKNRKLLKILEMGDPDKQVEEFNKYISKEENLKKFLQIFPVVATTCISARKLGEPKPAFDMVIMDEASQCSTAMALLPIIRGGSLMLVGDPQQLNPVIQLDPKDNQILKKRYGVRDEYDYIANSIYKVYLARDAVSDEVLLRYHYRCHRKIIDFNNKKYYNNKLEILSDSKSSRPLIFVDVTDGSAEEKNTDPAEAEQIVRYAELNRDKSIGVITPFANQREYIKGLLKERGLADVTCGTVHAFQGDEKDVILFSLALNDKTRVGTYNWLKNYRELINVATSRAREQLIVLGNSRNLERLHHLSAGGGRPGTSWDTADGGDTVGENGLPGPVGVSGENGLPGPVGASEENGLPGPPEFQYAAEQKDDIYELVEYVKSNGTSRVTERTAASRALGIKPYSTQTEEAFLTSLNHALGNILYQEYDRQKYTVHKEVPISQVFAENTSCEELFYTGRFDFVVYERTRQKRELPVFAIELDGREHREDALVRARDEKKEQICREHGFELIRIENSYARRYNYIKDILIRYFSGKG